MFFHAGGICTKYLNDKENTLTTLKCLALVSILTSVFYSAAMECGTKALADDGASAGEIWREPVTGMEMVWVPKGCFQMGCGSWTSDCSDAEKPVHEVCVDGFWMGKYVVTQGEWGRVMPDNPSKIRGDMYPVEQVSWEHAMQFIRKLNNMSNGKYELRLPTEAEWEYAARSGGKPEKYAGGSDLDSVAWYKNNSMGSVHVVGTKDSNGIGLYDMSGNVWQWCADIYNPKAYNTHQRNNPMNVGGGVLRVLRGGSWYDEPKFVRCANRHCSAPDQRYYAPGFRLVRIW